LGSIVNFAVVDTVPARAHGGASPRPLSALPLDSLSHAGEVTMSERHTLAPKPGFDWSKVTWASAHALQPECCSYCGDPLGEAYVPLLLWNPRGDCAAFCTQCCFHVFMHRCLDESCSPTSSAIPAPALSKQR
jgi:hypothetical protein